jgi:hypothetical protein
METNITIDLSTLAASKASIKEIESFIRGLNLMGSYVDVATNKPDVAALATSLIGNMNKVITINGTVIKSFDSNYTVGETVGWFADYTSIKF